MSISVTTTSQTITATVNGSTVQATTSTPPVEVAVGNGFGPPGPQGPPGTVETLSAIQDVEITAIATGDVLRWSANRWRNHAETQLTDGGNF